MPTRPLGPCSIPRCPNIAVSRGRCPAHRSDRGTRQQQGYTNDWLRRSRAMIKAQPYCSICGMTEDLTTDHIVPKVRGGGDDYDNLMVLCRSCNSRKGGR